MPLIIRRVIDGLKLMVWGFFKKVVIADKLALVVDKVYSDPTQYTGLPLIAAAISFADSGLLRFFRLFGYCHRFGPGDGVSPHG